MPRSTGRVLEPRDLSRCRVTLDVTRSWRYMVIQPDFAYERPMLSAKSRNVKA